MLLVRQVVVDDANALSWGQSADHSSSLLSKSGRGLPSDLSGVVLRRWRHAKGAKVGRWKIVRRDSQARRVQPQLACITLNHELALGNWQIADASSKRTHSVGEAAGRLDGAGDLRAARLNERCVLKSLRRAKVHKTGRPWWERSCWPTALALRSRSSLRSSCGLFAILVSALSSLS